jgi:hypothetical protein
LRHYPLPPFIPAEFELFIVHAQLKTAKFFPDRFVIIGSYDPRSIGSNFILRQAKTDPLWVEVSPFYPFDFTLFLDINMTHFPAYE